MYTNVSMMVYFEEKLNETLANRFVDRVTDKRTKVSYTGEYFDSRKEGVISLPIHDLVKVLLADEVSIGTFRLDMEGGTVDMDLRFHEVNSVKGKNHSIFSFEMDSILLKEKPGVILDMAAQLCLQTNPFYCALDSSDIYSDNDIPSRMPDPTILYDKRLITDIGWAAFFSQKLVKAYGRNKLISTPSWNTLELKNDGVMLIMCENPLSEDTYNDYINTLEKTKKWLGIIK